MGRLGAYAKQMLDQAAVVFNHNVADGLLDVRREELLIKSVQITKHSKSE